MKKNLFVFLGIAILVGGLSSINLFQNKKVSNLAQCCDDGCDCSNDKKDDRANN